MVRFEEFKIFAIRREDSAVSRVPLLSGSPLDEMGLTRMARLIRGEPFCRTAR